MKQIKNMYNKKYIKFVVTIFLMISLLFISGITASAAFKVGGYYWDWRFDIHTRRNITIRKQTYNYEFL